MALWWLGQITNFVVDRLFNPKYVGFESSRP
ncbi:hypothetical protein COLO4_18065 [Corchorus olitorius]|uniref:Uncharacterized protein n=1 Tax=Corchorus olitorius TaxID=93759 RepID=A0A1R3JAL4_9ROSI|nr:hypothetical protein COLO4_18065 [Corchorus olitorius]